MSHPKVNSPALVTALLLSGFGLAVWLRVAIGGSGVAQSAPAGLAFAACLVALGLAAGPRPRTLLTQRSLVIGLLGGLTLCLPATLADVARTHAQSGAAGYLNWALVVAVVATAEEYLLRGVLFDAILAWRGRSIALILTAVAFAGLHVPLYGWQAFPLDLAVGLWLGSLRLIASTWTAPAVAHTLADLLAWWLR